MPNKEKGEIEFACKGKTYILKFDFNAFCELEELLDKPIFDILTGLQENKSGMREIRKFFLAGLAEVFQSRKPIEEKLKEVGRIIQEIGGLAKANGLILEAVSASFPDAKESGSEK